MKYFLNTALLIISIFVFSGCNQKQVDINQKISDPHVIIENPSIYKWLQFDDVNYFKREDGLMEVEVRFRNFTNSNKIVSYKIDWMDENGFIQKSILSKWVIVEIEERRNLVIHGISPSTKIENFKIRLQEPTKDDRLKRDAYHYEYQRN